MSHILWLSLSMLPALFPGMILWIVNRFNNIRKINEMDKYGICLLLVTLIYSYFIDKNIFIKIGIILLVPMVLFFLHYFLVNWQNFNREKLVFVLKGCKKFYHILFIYPVCEEVIYRLLIYYFFDIIQNILWAYILISSTLFVFSHFFQQKVRALRLVPLAVCESLLFYIYKDISICIVIHIAYNILAYLYNSVKHQNGKSFY